MVSHNFFKKSLFLFLFFIIISGLLYQYFQHAFQIKFFADDYYFLNIARIHSFGEFIGFFDPRKISFYRPLSSEVFYFIIRTLGNAPMVGHIITFATFALGLYFLFKIINELSKDKILSIILILLYATHASHVFQLYWLATYQEVLMMLFLNVSFYYFLKKNWNISLLTFALALLSKEQAYLYLPFIAGFMILKNQLIRPNIRFLLSLVLVGLSIFLLTQTGTNHITSTKEYQIQFSPKLVINNSLWYLLWGLGVPNFLPEYFISIFKKPLPVFWELFTIQDFRMYTFWFLAFLGLVASSLLYVSILWRKKWKDILLYLSFFIGSYFVFLLPVLFIVHRWMVRLTIPLLFVTIPLSIILVTLLKKNIFCKIIAVLIIGSYLSWNYYSVRVHESSSGYTLDTRVITRAEKLVSEHRNEIASKKVFYIRDFKEDDAAIGFSTKVKTSFFDQEFIHYHFPDGNIYTWYDKDHMACPANAYLVESDYFYRNK